jgi:hypothetical protein
MRISKHVTSMAEKLLYEIIQVPQVPCPLRLGSFWAQQGMWPTESRRYLCDADSRGRKLGTWFAAYKGKLTWQVVWCIVT